MTRGVGVFGRVTISRIVATECYAAFLTSPEMDPRITDLHALGALEDLWMFNSFDTIEVRAGAIGHLRLVLLEAANRR